MVKAVRGAIQVEENSREAIQRAAIRLVEEIVARNSVREEQIVSLIFSMTRDLNKANPATALRAKGYRRVPLFCTQEAEVEGGAARILRVLLTYNSDNSGDPTPVYLDGAETLRPDLNGESI